MEFESNQPVNDPKRDAEETKAVARTGNQSRRLLITAAIATPAIIATSAQTARAGGTTQSCTSAAS
ncbi:hypothetical protein Enr13x_31090 [Stieleria neptunia]|uniref:Uncharacterized protein n=1 Tax=Stieleria neptunia TaxID=2527979 RepID=A0A518HQY7_9BACT|nr:hypothetical protein [Stieleria neptunia]QDV43254.1 hypothetical protein Enr13x_31090 [Stieleria neptunia]